METNLLDSVLSTDNKTRLEAETMIESTFNSDPMTLFKMFITAMNANKPEVNSFYYID